MSVSYQTEDRQWDIRVNVQEDSYLEEIICNVAEEFQQGKFKYVLIGGLEIGDKPTHSDYLVRHFHAAVIFNNRASKSSILKNWGIKEGNGYYMVPRNRELPYEGWRNHHTKKQTKIDEENLVLLEKGELPKDNGKRKAPVLRSEVEKKMKTDDIVRDMRKMIEDGEADKAFETYPRNYLMYGEKLKSMIHQQKKAFFGKHINPHIYLFGYPGTGKTSLLKWIYPMMYKKDLQNRFFDLYDETVHTHVMLEDLDSNHLDRLGIQFLKTLCDEAGFPIDQKYKTPQITRSTILVTSNQSIDQLINGCDDVKCIENNKIAIKRRFLQMRVDELQRLLSVKLINEYERKMLKKGGNEDPSLLYLDWNYNLDCPTGLKTKTPEEYQEIIRAFVYK
jgi:hypothetical protein